MSSNLNWSRVLTCGDTTCDSSNFEDPGTPEFHYLGRLESEAVADSSTPDKRDLPPLQDQPTAPHHGLRLRYLHHSK